MKQLSTRIPQLNFQFLLREVCGRRSEGIDLYSIKVFFGSWLVVVIGERIPLAPPAILSLLEVEAYCMRYGGLALSSVC